MFGVSITEMGLVAVVALLVVGPQKLPGMLRTLGGYVGKARRLMTEMRAQTGIDEILREEGIDGVAELRSLLRGEIAAAKGRLHNNPYADTAEPDPAQEYPAEGADARGALPDDLVARPFGTPEDDAADATSSGDPANPSVKAEPHVESVPARSSTL